MTEHMTEFEQAKTALEILRASVIGGACPHPAEALIRVEIMSAWECSECATAVGDETIARKFQEGDA